MSRDIMTVLQANNPKVQRLGRIYSRKQIEQAFLETFELIGGVQRLALWANREENYHDFLKLMMKLTPREMMQDMGNVLEYRSNVPASGLSRRGKPEGGISEGRFTDVPRGDGQGELVDD